MKSLTVLVAALAMGLLAHAQVSSKQAKIDRLLVVMKADAIIDQVMNQMKAMLNSQLPASATPEQRAKARDMQNKIIDFMKERMSWDKMRPQYARLYDETYTEEEISGILAFYESPAGQAMIAKMPALMQKSMAIAQAQMKDLVPEMERMMKESSAK